MQQTTSTVDPTGAASSTRWRALLGDESGFVLAQAALLLIPLLIFAAFATDIGSWYLQGQKVQRAADAAALAGVAYMPDTAAAEQAARDAAARNGYVDATPFDNSDFETGPLPQIRVTTFNGDAVDVEIRAEADAFLGELVLDSITIERYAVAEYVQPVHLGNPTSGLGTGTISESVLGLPNDEMWLAVTAYCQDHEQGDPFATGYYDGPNFWNADHRTCGTSDSYVYPSSTTNPTFDPDAYAFVIEVQPGSPTIDIDVYEPGVGCSDTGNTGDDTWAPLLNFEVYGPSTTRGHRDFIDANSPIATVSPSWSACISNSADGDGWWSLASGLANPGAEGGFYYVKVSNRHPGSIDGHTGDSYWREESLNSFSLRALRTGDTQLCAFSAADTTCPQVYALDWLPLYRQVPNTESPFYLAEVDESHAGEQMIVTFFDAAEGIDNLQFVDSNGTAMPFEWRYSDTTDGQLSGSDYWETSYAAHTDTCTWGGSGSNPCLDTSTSTDWNDHFVKIKIDIPDDYTCGADCWWQIRYVTGGTPTDRSVWSIVLQGDPVRLVE
ncbi:MAG: pilus assembly protein TadG-related protein [Actinomycetota bacterium]